jgi:hypothetical protein
VAQHGFTSQDIQEMMDYWNPNTRGKPPVKLDQWLTEGHRGNVPDPKDSLWYTIRGVLGYLLDRGGRVGNIAKTDIPEDAVQGLLEAVASKGTAMSQRVAGLYKQMQLGGHTPEQIYETFRGAIDLVSKRWLWPALSEQDMKEMGLVK